MIKQCKFDIKYIQKVFLAHLSLHTLTKMSCWLLGEKKWW